MSNTDADKLQDLYKVLQISRSMVATEDLDSLLRVIVDHSTELLDAERATLFLYDDKTNELVSRIAHGVDELRIPADTGVSGATVQSGETINVPDAYADPRFNREVDRKTGFLTRSILSVPLRGYDGKLVGVLQILNKRTGSFDEYDTTLAETLGAQAGVALQRATLIEHFLQKKQMERAMRIARDIQRDLLPDIPPHMLDFDMAGLSDPADETGGDIYDFMPLGDDKWLVMVADATGHGIGPAIIVAQTRAMMRAVCLQDHDVPRVLQAVNNLLKADLDDARFVTCFLGILDASASTITYASAGHGPILFYDRSKDKFHKDIATGPPLGIIEEMDYSDVLMRKFAPGDFVAITTDGFFEAVNPTNEMFGVDRLTDLLRRDRDLDTGDMITNLHESVLHFTTGLPQADDLTAVVIRKDL